jgi:hypothetical protein
MPPTFYNLGVHYGKILLRVSPLLEVGDSDVREGWLEEPLCVRVRF